MPVEHWIMSKTIALNPIGKENEGLTNICLLNGSNSSSTTGNGSGSSSNSGSSSSSSYILESFRRLVEIAPLALLGEYCDAWPLTKVLGLLLIYSTTNNKVAYSTY